MIMKIWLEMGWLKMRAGWDEVRWRRWGWSDLQQLLRLITEGWRLIYMEGPESLMNEEAIRVEYVEADRDE